MQTVGDSFNAFIIHLHLDEALRMSVPSLRVKPIWSAVTRHYSHAGWDGPEKPCGMSRPYRHQCEQSLGSDCRTRSRVVGVLRWEAVRGGPWSCLRGQCPLAGAAARHSPPLHRDRGALSCSSIPTRLSCTSLPINLRVNFLQLTDPCADSSVKLWGKWWWKHRS